MEDGNKTHVGKLNSSFNSFIRKVSYLSKSVNIENQYINGETNALKPSAPVQWAQGVLYGTKQ